MATEKKSFLLRIDPKLWEQLERLAASELRSVNAQVEFLLRDALVRRMNGAGAALQSPTLDAQANDVKDVPEAVD
jgi:hypothetical protein